MDRPLFTIGYEGATQPGLIAALREAGVELVIDVRAIAASRRPGFSKRLLAGGLEAAGIRYEHFKDLGTPKAGREAARRGNVPEMRRIMAGQLATPEAQRALAGAIAAAGEAKACLLCLERRHEDCHRALVADLMAEQGGFTIVPLAG